MQKVIKTIKDCVAAKTCCEETGVDCNQGRNCPVREGTHKPAEAVHQIQEPAPATAMDALREAEAALEVAMARILKADPGHSICVTSEAKALVAVRAALAATKIKGDSLEQFNENKGLGVVLPEPDAAIKEVMGLVDALQFENFGIVKAVTPYELNTAHRNAQKTRAAIESKLHALLATGGQAQAVLTGELIEAVDAWFARNTGLGGCSDKDVAELAAIFAAPQAQADARDAELMDFLEANAASLTLEDGLWEIVVRGKTMNWSTDGKTAREAIAAAKGEQQ